MLGFLSGATAAPNKPTTAADKRKGKRRNEILATAANPTAPARASQIDKRRTVRLHKDRREKNTEEGSSKDDDNVDLVGTKRKLKPKVVQKKSGGRVSAWERVKQFPDQTLEAVNDNVFCQACNKTVNKDKKSTLNDHCRGHTHVKAVVDLWRKKKAKQAHSDHLAGVYGSSLVPKELTTQIMAVEECLSAGILLNALRKPLMKEEKNTKEGSNKEDDNVDVVGTKRKLKPKAVQKKSGGRVSASERVKQFPDQTLEAVNGNVFCQACNKTVTKNKKSTLNDHCRGDTHVKAVVDLSKEKKAKQMSMDMSRAHSDHLGGVYGSSLAPNELTTQIMAVEECLSAGIPLSALSKPLMERKNTEEGSSEEDDNVDFVGTKRKLKPKVVPKKGRVRVSASERVKQFPDQTLEAVNGNVFCQACNKTLTKDKKSTLNNHCRGHKHVKAVVYISRKKKAKQAVNDNVFCQACNQTVTKDKKSTLNNHCRGHKHVKAVVDLSRKEKAKQISMDMFKAHSDHLGGVYGSSLAPNELTTQIMAVEGCLSAGIPLNALSNPLMKDFLHHVGVKLPGEQHLSNHIPFIEKKEMETILEELGDSNYSVVFDETQYRCTCFGIGIRFINKEGKITQRLLGLSMLSNSTDCKAINGEIMKILVDVYKLDRDRCRAFMLDGCAANLKALESLLMNFRYSVGVRCFSHLLNNCGNELASQQVDNFAGHLHVLLAHSHNAKDLWLQETKVLPPSPISHRWSSRFVWDNTMVKVWQGTKTFIDKFTSTDESRSKSAKALREELALVRPDGIHQELVLQLGFATAVDVGIHLTRATHLLEGDGFLLPVAYDAILSVRKGLSLNLDLDGNFDDKVNMPNVRALIRIYSLNVNDDGATKKFLENKAHSENIHVRKYAWDKIGDHAAAKERETIRLFEAARIFNFAYVKQHKLDAEDLDILAEVFPFVTPPVLHQLLVEKDEYNVAASSVDIGYDLWAFWRDNRLKFPAWYDVAKDVALVQPSSAMMERAFSILRACMDERQEQYYSDRIAASTLLKYNRRPSTS